MPAHTNTSTVGQVSAPEARRAGIKAHSPNAPPTLKLESGRNRATRIISTLDDYHDFLILTTAGFRDPLGKVTDDGPERPSSTFGHIIEPLLYGDSELNIIV